MQYNLLLFCVDITDNTSGERIGKEFPAKHEYDGAREIGTWFRGRKFLMFILSLKEIFVDSAAGVEIWYSDTNAYRVSNANSVLTLVYVLNLFLAYFATKRYVFKEHNASQGDTFQVGFITWGTLV